MTTHIMSMTYGPKIEGVRNGTIRQTIRKYNPKRPFKLGDKLLIHGWSGKPYGSPWSWRMESVVTELDHLWVDNMVWVLKDHYDLTHEGYASSMHVWDRPHPHIEKIAKDDGIVPPTPMELLKVLEDFHGKFPRSGLLIYGDPPMAEFQVIRW